MLKGACKFGLLCRIKLFNFPFKLSQCAIIGSSISSSSRLSSLVGLLLVQITCYSREYSITSYKIRTRALMQFKLTSWKQRAKAPKLINKGCLCLETSRIFFLQILRTKSNSGPNPTTLMGCLLKKISRAVYTNAPIFGLVFKYCSIFNF